jgi:HD-like signal output (HDOD) protein
MEDRAMSRAATAPAARGDRAPDAVGSDQDPSRAATIDFLTRVTGELSKGPLNLPCFPDIVPRVREALGDPKSTSDDIVKIAGAEPRLAARLLQTANSAVFNPGGQPLTNLRQAVTRLGHHLVQSVTMVFAIQQMKTETSLRPVAGALGGLWEKSIAVASICQVLAQRLRVPADKVFLTGLLHGIGCFYIMVRAAGASSGIGYDRLLADVVAERHPSVGRAVLEKWGFEAVMCEAVGSQLDYARKSKRAADITDVLIASVALAEALLEHNGDLGRCADINAFAALGLSSDDLTAILRHTEHTLGSLRSALGC